MATAFRDKARSDTLDGARQTVPEAYAANVRLAREVADVLRRNIVQGERLNAAAAAAAGESGAKDVWRESAHLAFPSGEI